MPWLIICAISYNIGVVGTLYVHPGFNKALHGPTSSTTGLITAIYYLGTWTSYLFVSHQVSDRLGRRAAVGIGALTICIGAAIQCAAGGPNPLAAMVIGRIFCGLGVAVVSTSVPMYQRYDLTYICGDSFNIDVVNVRRLISEAVML